MPSKDIFDKICKDCREIANKSSEVFETAAKSVLDILKMVKEESSLKLSEFMEKGEKEWESTRKNFEKSLKQNNEKLYKLHNDLIATLEEIRKKILQYLPKDVPCLNEIFEKAEKKVGECGPGLSDVAEKLAISDYDKLSVKQLLPKLEKLSKKKLEVILEYEKQHKNRVTIIRKIAQLLSSSSS